MANQDWKLDGEGVVVSHQSDIVWEDDCFFTMTYKGKNFHGEIIEENLENRMLKVKINHSEYLISKKGPLDELIAQLGLDKVKIRKLSQLKSPMPGRIVAISISVGDEIEVGDSLLTLEAMKMENVLKSEGVGIVKSIEVKTDQVVDKGAILVTFE
jgi:biotin carboxyl carrier protein